EKGSPVVPQTREAIIVHYCDDMTARIAAVDDAEAATPAGERWTNRIFMIDAPAYLGPVDGTDESGDARAGGTKRPARPCPLSPRCPCSRPARRPRAPWPSPPGTPCAGSRPGR